jgi:hypothetical protein
VEDLIEDILDTVEDASLLNVGQLSQAKHVEDLFDGSLYILYETPRLDVGEIS